MKCRDNNYFVCDICGEIRTSRSGMHNHLRDSHGWSRDQDKAAFMFFSRIRPAKCLKTGGRIHGISV